MEDKFNDLVELTSDDDIKEMESCKYIGEALQQAYPDHLWAVMFQGGGIVVKLMDVQGNHGFLMSPREVYSAGALKKHAIMAGGELLERSGQKRGKWDGQFHRYLDV